MALNFDQLEAKLTQFDSVEDGTEHLLTQLSAEIKAAKGDQAKIDALTAKLDARVTALATAVAANTPADPNAQPPADGGGTPPPDGGGTPPA